MYMFNEKWNTYFTKESPNEFFINYLNPFNPAFRMAITITYPLLPYIGNPNENIKLPEVGAGDILGLFPQYRELIEQNGDVSVMLAFLIDLSKEMVSYKVVNNNNIYKYLVVLHTAHNLELHIRDMKDEANLISLNNEVVEKNYHFKDLIELFKTGEKDSFNLTMYGRKFIEIYYPLAIADMKNGIKRKERMWNGR